MIKIKAIKVITIGKNQALYIESCVNKYLSMIGSKATKKNHAKIK